MSSPNPGIISTADETRPTATYLPLESLSAHVYIADVSARVVLSQLYRNTAPKALNEAHYVFPVPARAAVCSFEMRTGNGRRLKGVVKEITQAKAEYEQAVRQGRLAGLLQQFRRDVFAVCIGTIPPRTNVTVSLSYVIDLSEDDQHDTVRFHLPLHVGARYGAPPTSRLYLGTDHRARVSITVEVEMASEIARVTSPSHAIEEVSHGQSSQSTLENRYKCVRWTSEDDFLTADFVLVVQASGLDIPRCLAETLTTTRGNSLYSPGGDRTTALALTIVPRFNLSTLPEQEYLFLVDRSGSMGGSGINTAKRALGFLLRMLPSTGTKFNIFSFGEQCTSLWPRSRHYDNSTLPVADCEVDAMQADMGGTNLLPALQKVFSTKSDIVPTGVFVLTDGWVYDPQTIIAYVREIVASAPPSVPLRFFILGVGDGPSTDLCQGIADAGNGACVMAVQTEDLMLKSIRLVEAMRVSTVGALTVDWGMPGQVLQAPDPIPTISPGVRTVITTILSGTATPTQVTLRGTLSNGDPLEYSVPVHPLSPHLPNIHMEHSWPFSGVPPLLHTLAAHRYIQGLDGGGLQPRGHRFDGLSPSIHRQRVMDLIVELGIQYQVASSRTAFIAVDTPFPRLPSRRVPASPQGDAAKSPEPKDGEKKFPPDSRSRHESSAETFKTASEHSGRGSEQAAKSSRKNSPLVTSPKHTGNANGDVASYKTASEGTGRRTEEGAIHQKSTPQPRQTSRKTTASPPHRQASSASLRQVDFYACYPPTDAVTQEVLVLPDPMGGNKPVIFTAPPLLRTSIIPPIPKKSFWSLTFRPVANAMRQLASFAASAVLPAPVQQEIWEKDIASTSVLLDFSRSQAADGSFSLTNLDSTVGIPMEKLDSSRPPALASMKNGEQVWATAIAVAFFRLKHRRHKEVWNIVQDKAVEYGSRSLRDGTVSFNEILEEALALLSSSPS